ncbi:hypothetical protein VKT23_006252 [Stygiomarasmius scandens]|uniref:Uncharacterized protein n=1 Tax=Marasmiellus scandens TaxID=2682957 RepID=A0ABR1JMB2_9AGAR
MVALLLIIGAAQAVTTFAWAYEDLIIRFGKVFELDSFALVQLMSMWSVTKLYPPSISNRSSSYFGTRVWILSKKNMYLTVSILLSAVVVFVTRISED